MEEKDIPTAWYNIVADMKNKPLPILNPQTKQPLKEEDLYPLFSKGASHQEMNTTDAWIEIPEEVRELYKVWRPTPLVRAYGLEKMLDTPAHIYFKNESVSPIGSHKLNSAIAQAYYCKQEGITNITTETGAGQWGAALSYAAKAFGLELAVYMVKVSYHQKPYRRSIMQTFGAQVIASPSMSTKAGRKILTDHPNYQGSLGTAISEAVELAMQTPNCKYTLGSVLNHVMLHQTVIGLEAEKQMEMAGEYPDVVIGCFGGGSNFSGITFPFLRHKLTEGKDVRVIAAEPASCPKLTRGQFQYDFGDEAGYTPLIPMFTLGHNFAPGKYPRRWSTLPRRRFYCQPVDERWFNERIRCKTSWIHSRQPPYLPRRKVSFRLRNHHTLLPLLSAKHWKRKEEGKARTILFNLSGHGLIDMAAYDQYLAGDLTNYEVTDEEVANNLSELEKIIK